MKKAKINTEKIHLFHINLIESAIKDLPQRGEIPFTINVANKTMHNLEEERIKIGLYIELKAENQNNSNPNAYFNIDIDFHFEIKGLKKYYKLDENNNPVFYGLLISTLLGLSFSTARGIIYERLSNTNMQGTILPVVSAQKMLQQEKKNK